MSHESHGGGGGGGIYEYTESTLEGIVGVLSVVILFGFLESILGSSGHH